jgi:hypothetical protein
MKFRKQVSALGLALVVAIGFPAASYAAIDYGGFWLNDEAEVWGGSVYNEGAGITVGIWFRDAKDDGHKAYASVNHQEYQLICPPRLNGCYWGWLSVWEDQTNRYNFDYGWRYSTLHEEGHAAADWRSSPGICIDISHWPDHCTRIGYINP